MYHYWTKQDYLREVTKEDQAGWIRKLCDDLGRPQPKEGFEAEHTKEDLEDWIEKLWDEVRPESA